MKSDLDKLREGFEHDKKRLQKAQEKADRKKQKIWHLIKNNNSQ